ncbi:MAG: DUF2779 domain-containing protein, partial [Nanoarchaeota archaeon]|nr:DUF2779 domain-containing protein [Nanoarchaeota archaeon]
MAKLLTKSKYLAGLQCPKLLWTQVNDKDSIPEVNEAQQKIFDVGTQIGILATKLFPEGIKVSEDSFTENLNQSKELLKENKPLFEAGFMINNLFSRADILVPNGDSWDIVEVKSSTEVKDVNIHDVSFQKHVYELSGLKINKCYLMYVNNQYVKNGEIEPEKLFNKEDITEQVIEFSEGIQERINEMLDIINGNMPQTSISKNCSDPYECALKDICWKEIPQNSVFDLTRGGKKSWNLFEDGIIHIKDIPENFKLSDKQQLQKECELLNDCYINKSAIKSFIDTLQYPIYYFDFETINPCVPLYDGMSPYKKIAFQYSLHIQEEPNGKLKHISFLADHKEDPREAILKSMKENLGEHGTILAWNESFEKGVIKELVEYFPEFADWGSSIISRFNDLIIPFRNFSYYNPVQRGSSSIKKVLPALTD